MCRWWIFFIKKLKRQRRDEVEKVYGFGRCLQLYLQDEKLVKIKDKGRECGSVEKQTPDGWAYTVLHCGYNSDVRIV